MNATICLGFSAHAHLPLVPLTWWWTWLVVARCIRREMGALLVSDCSFLDISAVLLKTQTHWFFQVLVFVSAWVNGAQGEAGGRRL